MASMGALSDDARTVERRVTLLPHTRGASRRVAARRPTAASGVIATTTLPLQALSVCTACTDATADKPSPPPERRSIQRAATLVAECQIQIRLRKGREISKSSRPSSSLRPGLSRHLQFTRRNTAHLHCGNSGVEKGRRGGGELSTQDQEAAGGGCVVVGKDLMG